MTNDELALSIITSVVSMIRNGKPSEKVHDEVVRQLALAQPQWQPIEDYPKTPDSFGYCPRALLFDADNPGKQPLIGFYRIRKDHGEWWLDDDFNYLLDTPTHWMPLPEPPA